MAELLLDPDIRVWVILPIFFITLLFGLLRHYAEKFLSSEPENSLEKIKDRLRYDSPCGYMKQQ